MDDLPSQIRAKMEAAGLGPAAIRAFLFQYDKLEQNDAGLIPESSISPLGTVSSIEDETTSGDTSNVAARTVVLKLNGGLGTGMGLDRAKSLLKVREELTFLDIIARQFLQFRSTVAPELRLLLMNSFSTSRDTAKALAILSRTWRSRAVGVDAKQSAKNRRQIPGARGLAAKSILRMVSPGSRRYLSVAFGFWFA